ncbi:MAG: FAD-dependent oxidoreductase [Chromatiales bacterium]|nr:FAD-dependent oxidoreductase [Chromatiales bacterium]
MQPTRRAARRRRGRRSRGGTARSCRAAAVLVHRRLRAAARRLRDPRHARAIARRDEVNTADMYVTVEAGCTWQSLLAALEPHGVRMPFWGPLSGGTATVGGSLSQNAILWGSARYGVSAETVLGLDVVLADGSLLRTGAAPSRRRGPSSATTGPTSPGCSSATPARSASRRGHAQADPPPGAGRDRVVRLRDPRAVGRRDGGRRRARASSRNASPWTRCSQAQRMKRAGLAQDLKAVKGVIASARGLAAGLKEAAKVALAGRGFLDEAPYSMHVGAEGRTEAAVDGLAGRSAAHRRDARRQRGREHRAEGAARRPVRADDERHRAGGRTLAAGARAGAAVGRGRGLECGRARCSTRRRADLERLGVEIGVLTAIVGANAFVLEPVFYWPAPRTAYYQRVLDEATLAKFVDFQPNPEAEALVFELRGALSPAVPRARRDAPADRPYVSLSRGTATRGAAAARGDQAGGRSAGAS